MDGIKNVKTNKKLHILFLLYLQMFIFIDITVIIIIVIIIIMSSAGGTLFLKKCKIWLAHFCNKENNKNTELQSRIEDAEANVAVSKDKIFNRPKCTDYDFIMNLMHLIYAVFTKHQCSSRVQCASATFFLLGHFYSVYTFKHSHLWGCS